MGRKLVRGKMKIVPMKLDHVPQIAALEQQYFSAPWDEGSLKSELTNDLALWLVAEEDGHVAGYIGSQSVLGEADMMNVAVDPGFRRRGIAEALVTALIEKLRENGVYCLTLEVRASNLPARNLYDKLGFAQVGLRKNYYRKPKEDACILRKEW